MTSLRAQMREMSYHYPRQLARIPVEQWPAGARALSNPPIEVWRSRTFLVMVYLDGSYTRLSVVRTQLADGPTFRYLADITWDDLQRLKAECGRGDCWAVECYPPDRNVVNVQNMRHLFVLKGVPDYGWK